MCGIVGLFTPGQPVDRDLLERMNGTLLHRGPDGAGRFLEEDLGLAMRRLAILDLETGDQPIFNEDGSVVVVYNGEIYNAPRLRAELEGQGHRFRTRTDTEVLVHGYEAWGERLPERLNGMFAFALWDRRRRRLLLARDPLGIKPLYYAPLPGGGLAFASELRALYVVPGWSRALDPLALDWFLAARYIPAPRTPFQGVRKLPAAHRLIVASDGSRRLERFWDVSFVPDPLPPEGAQEALRQALDAAVAGQLLSDVPLGAFLSGGLDSSLVVGLMARHLEGPVRTFSVVFPGWPGFDESPYARRVADHFGTEHREIAVEADVAREWPPFAEALDEPFADPAALPTYLMARATRRHVTVVLTGEGADELFAGYGWYGWPRPWPLPAFLRRPLRRLAQRLLWGRRGRHTLTARLAPDFPTFYVESLLSSVTQSEERARLYRPEWRRRLDGLAPRVDLEALLSSTEDRPWQSRIQELDLKVWLEGDPLVKADRTTMLASLEARVPFLDRPVVELAARIPPRLHRLGGRSKGLLRAAFADLLPPEILNRPKHAFDVPISAWLRGPLRPHLERALDDDSPLWTFLRPEAVRSLARAHLEGRRDYGRLLWTLLHLAVWGRRWGSGRG